MDKCHFGLKAGVKVIDLISVFKILLLTASFLPQGLIHHREILEI